MKNTCYIVGALPAKLNFIPREGDLVIAADAGYLTLDAHGITPHVTLGDFDSAPAPQREGIIKLNPVKDDTDTMYAVKLALERGYTRFVLYGVLGGRADHSVASLQTLTYLLNNGAKGVLMGDGYAVCAIRNDRLDFRPGRSGVFSVFSFDEVSRGVSISGAKYELTDAVLTNGFPLGVSNEFAGGRTSVSVCDGTLHVFFPCEDIDEAIYPW